MRESIKFGLIMTIISVCLVILDFLRVFEFIPIIIILPITLSFSIPDFFAGLVTNKPDDPSEGNWLYFIAAAVFSLIYFPISMGIYEVVSRLIKSKKKIYLVSIVIFVLVNVAFIIVICSIMVILAMTG